MARLSLVSNQELVYFVLLQQGRGPYCGMYGTFVPLKVHKDRAPSCFYSCEGVLTAVCRTHLSSCRYTRIGHLRDSTVVKGSLLRYVGHTCPRVGTQA